MKGARHKEESTALFMTIPVGASFACDRRIYGLRIDLATIVGRTSLVY